MPMFGPPSAGGGAPTTVDYLVGTADAGLSAEIVAGTAPGGELGGTWASPTVDATHSGTSHADIATAALSYDAAHVAAADPHTVYPLSAGDSGGQTIKGGTGSGENLTLASTNHATKGQTRVGNSAYDETLNQLVLGSTTPWADPLFGLYTTKDVYLAGNTTLAGAAVQGNFTLGASLYLPFGEVKLYYKLIWWVDNIEDIGSPTGSPYGRPANAYVGTKVESPLVNATTGFQVAGAAASGNYLRGNGTNFVSGGLSLQDSTGLAWSNRVQGVNITMPANYSAYVPQDYEISSGFALELGSNAIMQVG